MERQTRVPRSQRGRPDLRSPGPYRPDGPMILHPDQFFSKLDTLCTGLKGNSLIEHGGNSFYETTIVKIDEGVFVGTEITTTNGTDQAILKKITVERHPQTGEIVYRAETKEGSKKEIDEETNSLDEYTPVNSDVLGVSLFIRGVEAKLHRQRLRQFNQGRIMVFDPFKK